MAIEIINTVDDVRRLAAERDAARAELESVRTEFENWKHTVSLFAKQHGEADEEVERLRAELKRWQDEVEKLIGERNEEREKVARLHSALLAVEWVYSGSVEWNEICPWCERDKTDKHGHRSDCARQIALGIVEGK